MQDEIKSKFKEASARAVAENSFDKLFASLDTDGSGELDRDEFTEAVRSSLKIDTATLSDAELVVLFDAVDADGSGEIDSGELCSWLFPKKEELERQKTTKLERNSSLAARQEEEMRQKFRDASATMSEAVGWEMIFAKYDVSTTSALRAHLPFLLSPWVMVGYRTMDLASWSWMSSRVRFVRSVSSTSRPCRTTRSRSSLA